MKESDIDIATLFLLEILEHMVSMHLAEIISIYDSEVTRDKIIYLHSYRKDVINDISSALKNCANEFNWHEPIVCKRMLDY